MPSESQQVIPWFSKVFPTSSQTALSCSCSCILLWATATFASACHKFAHVTAKALSSRAPSIMSLRGTIFTRILCAELDHLDTVSRLSPASPLLWFSNENSSFSFCFGSNKDPCHIKICEYVEFY